MKTLQRSLYALLLLSLIAFPNFRTSAQQKRALPADLNENSSLSEILQWLDKTSFGNARITLKDALDDGRNYIPPYGEYYEPAKHTFVFTQGFKLSNIEGCIIALTNDDARTISKSMELEESKNQMVAQLNLELHRMSPTRGRSTYRYTKNPEKARVLGAWRTEYRYHGYFSRTCLGLHLHSSDAKEPERWKGYNLAITFDSREMSEQFDAAFQQAIRLCKSK